MVQRVLICVGALWPLIAFAGGLGFSPLVTLAALLLSTWLLSHSTAQQARDTAIAAGLGLVVYALTSRMRSTT